MFAQQVDLGTRQIELGVMNARADIFKGKISKHHALHVL